MILQRCDNCSLNTDSYKISVFKMNYQNIYNKLIKNGQTRDPLVGYKENHHILPRSLGGTDEPSNLVYLTPREHFIAHLLLAKIHGGKMIYAVYMMCTRYSEKYITNRTYEKLRLQFIHTIQNDKVRAEKISRALKGRKKTEEHKVAYKRSRMNGDRWACPESRKVRQSIAMKGEGNHMWGKTHTEESRQLIREANKQQVICPHCSVTGGIAIMKRWHFDNCLQAPTPKPRKKYNLLVCPHCGKEGGGTRMISNHFDNCKKR
jgi:hypothetical protein